MPDFLTHDEFVRRFPRLLLDQRTFPKKRESVMTLLVSAMLEIEIGRPYTAFDIDAKLQAWVDAFGHLVGLDRVAVRRMLVDEGYLHRDRFGATYVLRARSPHFGYDWSIRSLHLGELVEQLEQERAERRQTHSKSEP